MEATARTNINNLFHLRIFSNRNKWINWWIGRQAPKDGAVKKLIEIYDKYPVLKNETAIIKQTSKKIYR